MKVLAIDLGTSVGTAALVRASDELDVGLVVLAAGFGTSGDFAESVLGDELSMIDLNCRSVAALSHHYAQRLAARGRGGLVLMSSLVGFQGVPRAANYAATKAYVQSLAEGLGAELAPLGIDVLASAPGPVHSGFASRARMTALRPEVVARDTLFALGGRSGRAGSPSSC